jgi:hypothetical protein
MVSRHWSKPGRTALTPLILSENIFFAAGSFQFIKLKIQ